MPDRNASINLSLKDTASAGTQQAAASFRALTAEELKAEQATLRMAQAYARLDAAQKNPAQGAQRLRDALSSATIVTQQHGVAIQTQIASLDNQAAKLSSGASLADEFGSSLKSSILGIIGPAALATAAIGVLKGAVDFTEESFKLKAALDTTNLSINLQLKNFRDVNTTLAEGQQFAHRYAITQEENAEAIQASIPLLRQSKSSLTDVEGVLSRLAVLKPEQGIKGAAFALAELEGGQSKSLATRFNIPIAKATELKNAIKNGGDAITVMDTYLNSVGLDMSTLNVRTEGATGKMNELAVETENLKLALGGAVGGPGLALLETRIAVTSGATRVLSGDFASMGTSLKATLAGTSAYNTAISQGKTLTEAAAAQEAAYAAALAASSTASTVAVQGTAAYDTAVAAATASTRQSIDALSEEAQKKLASKIETAELADQQKQLDADSRAAAVGLLGAGNQALILAQKYGIAADQAQFLIHQQQALSNGVALADQRKGEQTGTDLSAKQFNDFNDLARKGDADRAAEKKKADDKAAADKKKADDKAAADAKRLDDLQNQNKLINAKTSADKIAELQRQKAATSDPIEKQQLQNSIDQERLSTAKSHTSELNKQLTTQESIYDSINKQRDAELDLEELRIKGRQADRKAAADDKTAQNILRALGGRTDARAQDFRGRAEDVIALDDVERRKRAQQEIEKQATAGGTITDRGKLLQSVPSGGGATPQQAGPITPVGASAPAVGGGSGGGAYSINLVVDGKTLASVSEPYIMDALMKAIQTQKARVGA